MHPELDHDKIKKIQQSKEESKSSLSKLWSGLKSGFKHMKNYVLGESNKQELSLMVYLNDHFNLLTGKIPLDSTNPIEVVNEILYIFQSLCKYYFHYDGHSRSVGNNEIKKVCMYINNAGCTQFCFV